MSRTYPVLFVALLLLRCSSDSTDGPANTVCSSLVDDAPTISYTVVAAAPPIPTGGPIADGTYDLSALTVYTGVGGSTSPIASTAHVVLVISGNTMQQVGAVDGVPRSYTTTFTVSATTITTTDTCPSPVTSRHQFSASPTDLRVYDPGSGKMLEQTYTKR
jgi:hypothetical protein